ncbi:MAG TPA: hypothetical protein VKU41_06025 [Polyangiaceae bacterium]|nr:hypothetical protein [Polyangiaceae bacterium]
MASVAIVPSQAGARTAPGTQGSPFFWQSASTCFSSTAGIENSCTSTQYWQMPVLWDSATGPNKTILVAGTVSSGGSLSCTYAGFASSGAIVTEQNFPAFPAGNSQQSITVTSVPAGSFAFVFCAVSPNTSSVIVGLDYFPQ